MNPGLLNKRVELWKNMKVEDSELLSNKLEPTLIKTVWAQIIPKTGSLLSGREADTKLSKTTHVIKLRYSSLKDISSDNWLVYRENIDENRSKEHVFSIDYILNPYFKSDLLEVFCQEVME